MAVLTVNNLVKTYLRGLRQTPVHALKGVSFKVEPGMITGFLGANGAGKTTSIKCLLGLSFPNSGSIRYFGNEELSSSVKARIGFLPERPYFYEYLTGFEFLSFYAKLSENQNRKVDVDRIYSLLKRVSLEHAKDRPLRSYSKGMLQRIGIAQALVHRPEFVILDEPMTGLDPDGRLQVKEIIRETAAEGTAIFFSSHHLQDAEQICQNLVILKLGELVYEGPMRTLLERTGTTYGIEFSQSGKIMMKSVHDIADLQREIDSLRKAGSEILEIQRIRQSLEEAFVQIGFDKNSNEAKST